MYASIYSIWAVHCKQSLCRLKVSFQQQPVLSVAGELLVLVSFKHASTAHFLGVYPCKELQAQQTCRLVCCLTQIFLLMYCSMNVLHASRCYLAQGLQKVFVTVVLTQFCHVEHIMERRCKFNIGITMLAILCTALHALLMNLNLVLVSGKNQCNVCNLTSRHLCPLVHV